MININSLPKYIYSTGTPKRSINSFPTSHESYYGTCKWPSNSFVSRDPPASPYCITSRDKSCTAPDNSPTNLQHCTRFCIIWKSATDYFNSSKRHPQWISLPNFVGMAGVWTGGTLSSSFVRQSQLLVVVATANGMEAAEIEMVEFNIASSWQFN